MANVLELILKATTATFDKAIDTSEQQAANFEAKTRKHFDNVTQSAQRMGSGVAKASGEFSRLDAVGQHARTLGIALQALGLDAAASAEKLTALVDVTRKIGDAVPTMLGVAAAGTAIFGAFSFLKDSVNDAGKWQQQLAILGQTVKNQGGDWDALSQSVKAWAELQEKTTQFSRGEAVQAVTELTATGMSLADAMKVTRVAEDAAAATGKSLEEVNHGLMEAMHGRTQALTALGLGTKASIHDGMAFNDVLAAIEHYMGGAASTAMTQYEGKAARLGHTFETLREDVGEKFLGALGNIADALTGLAESVDKNVDNVAKAGETFAQFLEGIAQSGPVIVGVTLALAAAMLRLAIVITANLAAAFTGLLRQIAVYITETAVGAVASTTRLAIAIGTTLVSAVRKMALMFAIEGVGALRTLAGAAIGEVVPAIAAMLVSLAEILIPIALVVGAVIGLAAAWSHNFLNIRGITDAIVTFIVNRFGDLVEAVGRVIGFLGHIADKIGLHGLAHMFDGASKAVTDFGKRAEHAKIHVQDMIHAAQGFIGGKFHAIMSFFNPAMPKLPANPADTNTGVSTIVGGRQGGGGNPAAKAGHDVIKRFEDAIANALQHAAHDVVRQKNTLTRLDDAEADVKARKPHSIQEENNQTAELARINELRRAADLQLAQDYLKQIAVQRAAVHELQSEAAKIHGNPKLKAQYEQLTAAARQHQTAIDGLSRSYEEANLAAKKTVDDTAALYEELHRKQMAAIKAEIEMRDAQAHYDAVRAEQAVRVVRAARIGTSPVQAANDALEDANAAQDQAQTQVNEAAIEAAAAVQKFGQNSDEARQATIALTNAQSKLVEADASVQIAVDNLNKTLRNQNPVAQLKDKILQSVPALNAFVTALQHGETPIQALGEMFLAVFEQTRSFKDLIQILQNVFKVLAAVLDAIFLPVIRALAQVLTFVVNIFITFYNAIATVVSLLGIHIERLHYLNNLLSDFGGDSKPLLDVIHDLPTLKEYGAGQYGALMPDDGLNWSLTSGIAQLDKDNQMSFGKIIEFLAVLAGIDWLTHGKFFSEMGQWFQTTWQHLGNTGQGIVELVAGFSLLTSHTGGILGILEKILGVILIIQGLMQIGGLGGLFGHSTGGLTGLAFGGGGGGLFGAGGLFGSGGLFSPTMGSPTNGGWLTFLNNPLGNGLAGAAGGALIGNLLNKLTGGNQTWGTVGGAVGGGLASGLGLDALLGVTGPWGMLAGALLGGAIGGLFGPHTNAHDNPDIYNPQGLSQGLANVGGGPFTASGVTNVEDSSIKSALGGQTEGGFIAQFIKNNPQMAASLLTPEELKYFTSAQGNYGQNYEANGNVKNMANGDTLYWQQVVNDASDAVQKILNATQQQQQQQVATTSPTDMLKLLFPGWDQLDAATQAFIEQCLGMTSAVQQTSEALRSSPIVVGGLGNAIGNMLSGVVDTVAAGGSAVASAASGVLPGVTPPGAGNTSAQPTTNQTINQQFNQSNTIGSITGSDMNSAFSLLGRRAAILARTQPFAYVGA